MSSIACCNFPTTILVLDDNQNLLDNIQLALYGKYKCICTSNPTEAYDILNKNRGWTKALLEKGVSQLYSDDEPSAFSLSVNVSLLKKQICNANRFKHIIIAIVDYDMPTKSGLELIREINDPQLKVIMLTGKATPNTVIQAFNDKEIHRYVSKGDPDSFKKVLQYINELQAEFFFDFSKFISDSLKESDHKILENKSFVALFDKVVQENKIIESYLLDESGSFLMLDASGKNQVWLIIKSEEDIRHFYELAEDDPHFPAETLKKLENHKLLTHFNAFKESTAQASTWRFLEAQPLDAKKYYYAIAKNDSHFQMERAKIKSYQEFLKI
jgi:CheY-like chemotaxis protein